MKNCLRITHQGETIQLSWQRGQSPPRFANTVKFEHPFTQKVLEDLRWYLEDYLSFPYELKLEKAKKIEQKFQEWGETLYNLVFRSSEKARIFFQRAIRTGLDHCELAISSDDPTILNLPWELLYSPDYGYLVPLLATMFRSLSSQPVWVELGDMPEDRLNILLIIARPHGEWNASLRTIAHPLLEALVTIRPQVSIKLLRPPSFQQFKQELNTHKGFYHIVHFDGHDCFNSNSQALQHTLANPGQGILVFEKEDGSPEFVTAAQIAQNLVSYRVPIFILNTCHLGQIGKDSFSLVATQLISLGVKSVIAMAYSVHTEAAKRFIGRLYKQLVLGDSLSSAMAGGRREIFNKRDRPSPKGCLPLCDWIVPVLYQQESYTPFPKRLQNTNFENIMWGFKDAMPQQKTVPQTPMNISEAGTYGFVGRDYEILRLEKAFRQNQIILLQGTNGVGKTELALGFARWLWDTQGRTGGIFFTSFAHGATLNNVVNQIGRTLMGDSFSQFPFAQQRAEVLQYLQTNPCLLIWDNFETVIGFPQGNKPLLTQEAQEELKQWLKEMRGQDRKGLSWVLITSCQEETWLDCDPHLENLGGLSLADAEELAAKILQSVRVDRAKLPDRYLELLQLLDGHPFCLRVVLPYLKAQSPTEIIEALHQLDTFQGSEEECRAQLLTVSLDYAFTKLSERARQHLPFLAFFYERVDAHWLHAFSSMPDHEYGHAYCAVFGENLQKSDWLALLNEAASAGILEDWFDTIYTIHPALSWYLRLRLSAHHIETEVNNLEKKLLIFYARLANKYNREFVDKAELATNILLIEEPNLLQYLRLAEQQQDWANAQFILQALGEMYQHIGNKVEFWTLRQRALTQIDSLLVTAKAKRQDALDFWIYLQDVDANEALQTADLERARAVHQKILNQLTDPSTQDGSATEN